MMSSAVTSPGAMLRANRKRAGSGSCRALTCPKPSTTPCWERMRLAATRSSMGTNCAILPPKTGAFAGKIDSTRPHGFDQPDLITKACKNGGGDGEAYARPDRAESLGSWVWLRRGRRADGAREPG